MSMTGFYRPTSEERKQEVLADIFKFRPGKVEVPITPRRENADQEEMWPDVEVSVPAKKTATGSRVGQAPTAQKTTSTAMKKVPAGKGSAHARPVIGIKSTNGSGALPAKPKALGERDSNSIVKKVMNPALRDFENDKMGKIIKAKLQETRSNETEGFML